MAELVPATAEAGWSVFMYEEPKRTVYAIPDRYVSDSETGDEAYQTAKKCRETLILKDKITASDCETTDLDAKRNGKTKKIYSPSTQSKKKKKNVPLPEPLTTDSVGKEKPDSLLYSSEKTSGVPEVLNDTSRNKDGKLPLSTSERKEDSSSSCRANIQRSMQLIPETPPTPTSPTLTPDSPKSVGVIEATPPKNSPVLRRNVSPVKRDLNKDLEDYFSKKFQYETGLNDSKEKADEDEMPMSSSPKIMSNTARVDKDIMQALKGIKFPMDKITFEKYIVTSIITIKNQLQSLQAAPALEAGLENGVFQMGNLDFPLKDVEELKVFLSTLMTDVKFCKKLVIMNVHFIFQPHIYLELALLSLRDQIYFDN
ncbi:uncharacterized protein LOC135934680 [Cloeon dipterum]|uniref:uncharacterized protein LOC135934680 n=1 Tax=Cloeon dipterum TaxID=197152 RepID=UPI00321FC36A